MDWSTGAIVIAGIVAVLVAVTDRLSARFRKD
jgi:hypothetical protein